MLLSPPHPHPHSPTPHPSSSPLLFVVCTLHLLHACAASSSFSVLLQHLHARCALHSLKLIRIGDVLLDVVALKVRGTFYAEEYEASMRPFQRLFLPASMCWKAVLTLGAPVEQMCHTSHVLFDYAYQFWPVVTHAIKIQLLCCTSKHVMH